MRRIDVIARGALVAVVVATDAHAAAIDRVAWLAGCWRGGTDDRTVEEQWMAPRGGLMLGSGRTASATRVTGYEQMRIETTGDGLVFTSKPLGKPEDSFAALPGGDDAIVFENLAHPFPQRIVYRQAVDGTLQARIEGMRGERLVGVDFAMSPVACGTR